MIVTHKRAIKCSVECFKEPDIVTGKLVDKTRVKCSKCKQAIKGKGVGDKTRRRLFRSLHTRCPLKENNYYTPEPE